jgi:hypothetical protein
MKKIVYGMLTVFAVLLTFASCSPSHEDFSPKVSISTDQLTAALTLTPKSQGNNNITVTTSPTHYIKVYDADMNQQIGEGTIVSLQVAPPAKELNVYVETMNEDGSITKSGNKSVAVTEYTDLPAIYDQIFGDGNGGYTTTYWTWDTTDNDGVVWGNGGYMSDSKPAWWQVTKDDIDSQAADKGLAEDGLKGWFSLSLSGVTTSRGENGSVKVSENSVKTGWDIGTITFSGTIPLMGVQVNFNNARQFTYQILKADGDHLYLCAAEPNVTSSGGTAWFWCFKKTTKEWCDAQ